MFELTNLEVRQLADEANFNRNGLEKVLRLFSVLRLIRESEVSEWLILKGGTAINLFMLDLPRLSVDIDLDFNLPLNKEETHEKRKAIDKTIKNLMANEGYHLSEKSKFAHSLDSYVFSYTSTSNSTDVLKIEINYSDRIHVLKPQRSCSTNKLRKVVQFQRLSDEELIGSKINALLTRTTPRDVYDTYLLFKTGCVRNKKLIRKIAIFYACLGTETPINFEKLLNIAIEKIRNLTFKKVKESLIPMLHKGIIFDIEDTTTFVVKEISDLFIFDEKDMEFVDDFNNKIFSPNKLFDGMSTNNLTNHPMGIWKTK